MSIIPVIGYEGEPSVHTEVIQILFTHATRDFTQEEAMEKLTALVKMDRPEGTIAITPKACAQLLKCLTQKI